MESIYYVMAWACHRRCRHCYESRFRPYAPAALGEVVAEAMRNFPRIVDHFPERMTYVDPNEPPDQQAERTGRIILSGGEALLDAVRETVTYPVIARLQARYRNAGGVRIVVQTTGDLLTDRIVGDLLERGIHMISVASVDDFHVGMEGADKQRAFVARLTELFERHGMRTAGGPAATRDRCADPGPLYGFFGATPESWIGKLWPRGRAWENSLPRGSITDNFCNRWSGGLHFLRHRFAGSEVSVEPDGSVYPCCVKTALPLGNLVEEALIDILDSLAAIPAFQAIDAGHPERMGIADGWDEARFLAASRTTLPDGRAYANLCIGCDRFHRERLGPVLAAARARRRERARLGRPAGRPACAVLTPCDP
jgi:hypothetical protein